MSTHGQDFRGLHVEELQRRQSGSRSFVYRAESDGRVVLPRERTQHDEIFENGGGIGGGGPFEVEAETSKLLKRTARCFCESFQIVPRDRDKRFPPQNGPAVGSTN